MKKSIITMMLALVAVAGCIDKSGADFEASLEGQLGNHGVGSRVLS